MSTSAYEIRADNIHFRHLIFESDWRLVAPFMHGRPINYLGDARLRYRTLEEYLGELSELSEEENTEPILAYRRFREGPGDCVYVLGLVASLVFSSVVCEVLGRMLTDAGQLFPVAVNGDPFFIFNCTRVLDAVDPTASLLDSDQEFSRSRFQRYHREPLNDQRDHVIIDVIPLSYFTCV
jgi:hypothetical protein